jgi:hypothetical protein
MSKTRRFSDPSFRNQERVKNGGKGDYLRNKERAEAAKDKARWIVATGKDPES